MPLSTGRYSTVEPGTADGARVDEELVNRVRARLVSEGARLTSRDIALAVREEAGTPLGDGEVLRTIRLLHREFLGAGPLESLLNRSDVTDVLVSGPNDVWLDRGHGLERAGVSFADEEEVRRLAQRLALAAGRRLDDAQPWVDGWLPENATGSTVRLHAVLAPVAADGTCVSLRVLRQTSHDLASLRRLSAFDSEICALLRSVVTSRLAFLVTGSTGSGKTTLLGALLGEVPDTERIVCVEEARELRPAHPHVVRLVARPPNVEGAGQIRMSELVRQALRMRPDRIVVGEARGAEVRELLDCLNTGHEGGAGTVHANSPAEVPARMEALAAHGGVERGALHSQLAAAIRVVLHMRRTARHGRHLAGIGVLRRSGSETTVRPAWEPGSGWARESHRLLDMLAERSDAEKC
ncbi:ATPase [Actinopolyspora erythraea]|uniref:ATPase n=1 Tax=Actinopolyspora erythraea TaxID=414996 RepID=A0A223RN18_9ACTN|nr:TadA family conjugal transfer-associated ATPase [Actinopolyspora erythraea]ASU77197.1 ATPase [Actinopolyspora erythraea]